MTAHDSGLPAHRRQDNDVWKHFSRELERRQVLQHFTKKTIAVADDHVEFEHAWKNGVWHCLAPVSFDLASADSIREKAHKWLGQVTSVSTSAEPFKLYYLVEEPPAAELRPAFESALRILAKGPRTQEVVPVSRAAELSERLAAEVLGHEDRLQTG